MKRIFLSLFVASFCYSGFAQGILDSATVNVAEETELIRYLAGVEKTHAVRFFFKDEWLEPFRVETSANGKSLRSMLDQLLLGSEIKFTLISGYGVVFVKNPQAMIEHENLLTKAVTEKRDIKIKTIGNAGNYSPGKKLTLTGVVVDESSDLPISGAIILVNNRQAGMTGANGHYQVILSGGEYVVSFRYFNFNEQVIDLKIYADGKLDIELQNRPVVLEEVVVSDQAVVNRRVGQSTLVVSTMKRASSFLGEVDVIKQIQNQPGVTTVGEVASGFNVRGGGTDQNLVLYDGVPIFNTSHALGFFTAFNSDALDKVSFYRGGIPAEYGGRVSSVLDIVSKEGSNEKWQGGGGIGIISSYLTTGGPIKKDTTNLMASVRASYSDWMLNTIKSNYQDVQQSSVSFYDASLKLTHKINRKTKLIFSGYTSFDRFSLTNDTLYYSRNMAGSIRVDRTISEKLFGSLFLGFGKYEYKIREEDLSTAFDLKYSITYPSLKLDFNYDGRHKISFGLHNTFYDFSPGEITPTSTASDTHYLKIQNERSLESALYLSDVFYLNEDLKLEAGIRASVFNRIGPGVVYQYDPDKSIEIENVVDSVSYGSGDIMKTYTGLEPRFSAQYTLNESSSIKFGYNRMFQYIHLVTNTAAVAPVDIWQSSNSYFKPQVADQFSLGYFRNLKENTYEAFADFFYKKVQNTLDFKDGAKLILNKNPETTLLSGNAEAYGVEVSLSKIKGRLLGSVNYTFSRSLRKTNGIFDREKINDGEWYASNYDQPHVVQVNWRYGISRRYFFSGTFLYHTGRPMSLPVSAYRVDGIPVLQFADRNSYRIPDYHRLDLSLILEGSHKRKKLWDGTWIISFYNVYARKNAYSVFYRDNGNGRLLPYKLSVIGSIIPSVSYSFKF